MINNYLRKQSKSSGFSLVELLVVVAIIGLLTALILPVVAESMEKAKFARCKHNLHELGSGFIAFMDDHEQRVPGVDDYTGDQVWQGPWLGKEAFTPGSESAGWKPKGAGTVMDYMGLAGSAGNVKQLLRCSSLRESKSNTLFDYTMVGAFAGAKVTLIPGSSMIFPGRPYELRIPTPLLVEEDPETNGGPDLSSVFEESDRLGMWHRGHVGNFLALDGSVQSVNGLRLRPKSDPLDKTLGPRCRDWWVIKESGDKKRFNVPKGYGSWSNEW